MNGDMLDIFSNGEAVPVDVPLDFSPIVTKKNTDELQDMVLDIEAHDEANEEIILSSQSCLNDEIPDDSQDSLEQLQILEREPSKPTLAVQELKKKYSQRRKLAKIMQVAQKQKSPRREKSGKLFSAYQPVKRSGSIAAAIAQIRSSPKQV